VKSRKLFIPLAAGILIILIAVLAGEFFRNSRIAHPRGTEAAKVVILIEPGDNLKKVVGKLKDNQVISNEKIFGFIARLKGVDKRIQSGEYEFEQGMGWRRALDIIVKGRQKTYRLLIPAGYNIFDIAREIEKIWPGQGQNFLYLCKDPDFIRSLGMRESSLEGYLYPDTYLARRYDSLQVLIKQMVDNFNKSWKPEYEQRAIDLGYTRHQIITIASIIEKEAGKVDEKPVVGGVIYNRLKKGMGLYMDPTVIYGLMPDFNGNLVRSDLKKHTPYNTYQIIGLPPGPISSPGDAAIRGALWPEKVDYLFFVSKGDGSHFFSSKYEDHLKAINLYQHGGTGAVQGEMVEMGNTGPEGEKEKPGDQQGGTEPAVQGK